MESGIVELGYLGIEASRPEAWRDFFTATVGLTRGADDFGFRMDARMRRYVIEPGAADDVAYSGWLASDGAALTALEQRLTAAGVAWRAGGADQARRRGVAGFVALSDPAGNPLEIGHGAENAAQSFASPLVPGGFVTGDQGLGHVVINVAPAQYGPTIAFYRDLLGLGLSDTIEATTPAGPLSVTFFHANPRHHSLSVVGMARRKRTHHIIFQVADWDDFGRAFDRCQDQGVEIVQGIGRHPNDRMTSFYGRTPSGFQFELGWGGRTIGADWRIGSYDRLSDWGHRRP
ncbi:MAG TPA: VOC family protein [Alphaproteobacteria bacterium]|jgi:2,3-dihydroxybiphenyl 1,2-dioxygenase|nr:VOC family protein [Alphaproteobacteria bacterium]MDP7164734.1 VOC family protein [Alphaproteobacteria bacterium]MDP7428294.1 VOC family protein [Alphaproteobacteria bacterium]HJM51754.1 VOC family protein [Alphaproteobacteria bacterium]